MLPHFVSSKEWGTGTMKGWECSFEETNILNGTGVL
jgi:hypothetical protein